LRGAAHVGALKCLHDHGIRPSAVSGTSAGSIVAGLYASGLSIAEMERVALSLRASSVFDVCSPVALVGAIAKVLTEAVGGPRSLLKWAPNGVLRGQRLETFLRKAGMSASFEKMRLPCIVTSTEVDNARKVLFTDQATAAVLRRRYRMRGSRTAVITGVSPVAAVRASCAIPGVYIPKVINGMQLIDGGVKDYLPLEPLDLLGCDILIGVDLGYAGDRREGIDNIAEVVSQSLDIMGANSVDLSVELLRSRYRNRVIRVMPRIYDVGLLDTKKIPDCISRGYAAMEKSIAPLMRLVRARSV
jgi:NTE family protein